MVTGKKTASSGPNSKASPPEPKALCNARLAAVLGLLPDAAWEMVSWRFSPWPEGDSTAARMGLGPPPSLTVKGNSAS